MTLDGTIDFTDLSQAKLNLGITARDFNLINAPKRKGAEAYGKVYVDLFGRMQGTLDNLDIRGRLVQRYKKKCICARKIIQT